MAELIVQWQPQQGETKTVKIPATKGSALTSKRLDAPTAIVYPVAVAVEDGWVISVPEVGSKGTVAAGGKDIALSEAAKSATWTAKDVEPGKPNELKVLRFKIDANVVSATLEIPGGRLAISVEGVAVAASGPKPVQTAASTRRAAAAPKPAMASPQQDNILLGDSDATSERSRKRFFRTILILVLLLDIAVMAILGIRDVPEDAFAQASELPERFAKLIVPQAKPEEESSGGGDEAKAEVAPAPAEEPAEEGGGPKETASAPRSKEEVREAVRSKGILAVFASKRSGGGALADVLSGSGVAAGLDQALSDVGGVVVATRGMDVTTGRGAGGAQSAGIGDLSGAAGEGRNLGLGDKAKKQISAEVKTASFTSQGSLSADSIRAVVERNIRGVKACYEKALTQQPDLQGKVVVKFTIGPEGKITEFSIEESTMGNKEVEGCILSRLRRWEFPKPDQGPVTVSYPFIFTASG